MAARPFNVFDQFDDAPRGPVGNPTATALFLGEKSATADREALARAKSMDATGADRRQILKDTGWFFDGREWQYETDDRGFAEREAPAVPPSLTDRVKRGLGLAPRPGRPLFEAYPHPEVQSALPQSAGNPRYVEAPAGEDMGGQYGQYYRKPREVVRVQEGPGAGGYTPAMVRTHEAQHWADDDAGRLTDDTNPNLPYQERRSEIRAENAARRHGMSPQERRDVPPWETAKDVWDWASEARRAPPPGMTEELPEEGRPPPMASVAPTAASAGRPSWPGSGHDPADLPDNLVNKPQYLELPGMRLPVYDMMDRPGWYAFNMARQLPMMMGYTGNDAAVMHSVARRAEQFAGSPTGQRLMAGIGGSAVEVLPTAARASEARSQPPVDPDMARSALPRPDRPQAGAGQYGLPYIPPLEEGPPQAEMRAYQPTLEDKARVALTQAGIPPEQASRAAAPIPYTPPGMAYGGGQAMGRGYDEGDPGQMAAGAAMTGLAVAPGAPIRAAGALIEAAAPAVGRAASAAGQAIREAPWTAGGLIAAGGTTVGAAETGAPAQAENPLARFEARQQQLSEQKTKALSRREEMEQERSILGKITSASSPDEIKAAQERLNALGYNAGKADGKLGTDGRKALASFQADRRKEIEALNAELGRVDTAIGENDAARQRAEGDARLRDVEEKVPAVSAMVRKYGPLVGYGVGASIGIGSRALIVHGYNRIAQRTAERADALMRGTGSGDWAGRAARVNQFWSEGQHVPVLRNQRVPFTRAPEQTPAFQSSPTALAASALYQPSRTKNLAVDAGVVGVGIGESVVSDQVLGERARAEVATARAAMQKDPSEANITRYQGALDLVAYADLVSNAGRGMALGYVGAAPKVRRDTQIRPNVNAAEAERTRVDEYLRRNNAAPLPPPAGPQSGPPGLSVPSTQTGGSGAQRPAAPAAPPGGPPPKVESWETPSGEVIKRAEDGVRWRSRGRYSNPPPKGSKRLSMYDRMMYWAGYA